MKRHKRFVGTACLWVVMCHFCTLNPAMTQGASSGAKYSIADLAWMAGGWKTAEDSGRQVEEHWTLPAGGSMLGMNRTVAGNRTAEFEFLRMEQRVDAVYYVAHPNGRCPGTDFRLTRLTDIDAVFENPEHDFPKRILYRKGMDGSLHVTIDGGEETRSIVLVFHPL